jgi:hypothetical protein
VAVLEVAAEHQRDRKAIAARAAAVVGALWRRVDRKAIAPSWSALLPLAVAAIEQGQAAAAGSADAYMAATSEVFDLVDDAAAAVRVAGFVGVASDGRELLPLMFRPAVSALGTIARGGTEAQALAAGRYMADMITRTQVADAGRAADATALTTRAQMTGYVRVLSPPSCSRCVILAGKRYRWNTGFNRHPRCDCTHLAVPSASAAEQVTTQPRAYFESLTGAEQDRVFTVAGAEAIRLGADPSQVVNARRGAAGLAPAGARITAAEAAAVREGRLAPVNVFGRQLFVTTEGASRQGPAASRTPRLMPESILQIAAGDRAEAVRLLRRFGYLL